MSAFNKRFTPTEVAGVPAAGPVGAVVALVCGGLLGQLMPAPVNVVFIVIAIIALFISISAFWLGEEFTWLPIKLQHFVERRCRSQFGDTE